MPITNTPLMTLPNRRTSSEKVRVRLSMKLSGIMIGLGEAKVREIAAHAARTNAEPDHRDEDEERERGVGLEMGRRRFDARDQRRPVGDEDEGEQRADEGAIGGGLGPHRVADLAVHGVDDQLEGRLASPTGRATGGG